MRRLFAILLLAACSAGDERTEITIQRIFGACEGEYGRTTDIAAAEGECGIMTAMINRFEAENPDIRVKENVVFWPGYDQLTAQLAANGAPDLVTMHGSVISDYQARGLLLPLGERLDQVGIDTDGLTAAARRSVTIDGQVWGLPIDTWAPLWHVNMNLFAEAGLVQDGRPVMPSSRDELMAQAAQFRERTGKPYFVQATANEYATFTRNFYTFVLQQDATLYEGRSDATFRSPAAAEAIDLFREVYERGHTTKNQDYSASVASFLRGDGGVFLVGTWMVGTFEAEAKKTTGPFANGGYTVLPYPQLYERGVTFADGHSWVMPKDDRRTEEETEAALRFLAFFAEHGFEWSRTGHLPVFEAIIRSPEWLALPHRENLAPLATTATPLPKDVRRQFPIETIVGQEAGAAVTGEKSTEEALADMERRVDAILQNL